MVLFVMMRFFWGILPSGWTAAWIRRSHCIKHKCSVQMWSWPVLCL